MRLEATESVDQRGAATTRSGCGGATVSRRTGESRVVLRVVVLDE